MSTQMTIAAWAFVLAAATTPEGTVAQGSGWANNGATACKKLLTPAFMAAILANPAGESQPRADGHGCVFGGDGGDSPLLIELYEHISTSDWDRLVKMNYRQAIAVSGVGDKAIRSDEGYDFYAWKTGDRTCAVKLVPLGSTPKLAGDALAKKFGEICNQLFALR
jgi:hypothetical protein